MDAKEANNAIFKGEEKTREEIMQFYAKWAINGKYDEHLSLKNSYTGPKTVAKEAAKLYQVNQRPTIKILDVAAGTGQVAEELRYNGFEDIDALDPSEAMLDIAKGKKLYKKYICAYLNETAMPTFNGAYDCITVSGGFGQSHLPVDALCDLLRLTKTGGYILIVMREEFIHMPCYKDSLEPLMQKLESEEKWRILERSVFPDYVFDKAGLLFIFEVK